MSGQGQNNQQQYQQGGQQGGYQPNQGSVALAKFLFFFLCNSLSTGYGQPPMGQYQQGGQGQQGFQPQGQQGYRTAL